jgi:3-phenylpropionate/trans-cinnamate dioxygenase ferredoxin subunit
MHREAVAAELRSAGNWGSHRAADTRIQLIMPDFVRVAKVSELSDPGKMLVEVDDRLVALFKVGGQLFALDDVCTHDGGPLAEGKLEDHTIACPRHGAKFDIRNGRALTMPATQPTAAHEVKVVGDEVFVKLSA